MENLLIRAKIGSNTKEDKEDIESYNPFRVFYISIFSPLVAVGISLGGGVKLYEQIASNVEKVVTLIITTV